MALTLHPVPGKAKSKMICEAFATGAQRGIDGHVFYGVTDGNRDAWERVQRRCEDFYFIDGSYFDKTRGTHFRVTYNRIQHRGLGTTDGKRFDALGIEAQPGRHFTERPRILAVHQSDLFMDVIARNPHWVSGTLDRLVASSRALRHRPWLGNKAKLSQTLQQAFADTDLVVTHSSAAAVEAALAGLDIRVSGMSAAYAIQLGDVTDRRQWAGVLADNQFTISEMKDGTAWSMLHPSTP